MYFDKYYLFLVVPTIFISLWAQFKVKSTFRKYSKVKTAKPLMGSDVARIVLESAGIVDVDIEPINGTLTDHFDPRKKILRLSEPVHSADSVAAAGVAAHESGHAVQQKVKYGPLVLRSTLVPAANIGSTAGPYLALFGLMLNNPTILKIGIAFYCLAVLFYLVTLPVEFNASRRAIYYLKKADILTSEELVMAKKVLFAAAMTYVASALTSLASLLRLILLSRSMRGSKK